MKLKIDEQLSENFWANEFLSENDKQEISFKQLFNLVKLSVKLQILRLIINSRIDINSGWRGVLFNKLKNGSVNSYHLEGLAADIKFDFSIWNRKSLTKVLQFIGFTNVNFYWTADRKTWVWLHVDIGKTWNGEKFNYRDMDANTQKEITIKAV